MDLSSLSSKPIKFKPNRVWRPFVGGKLLDKWQGITPAKDGHKPEQWVASTMQARNMKYVEGEGLSKTQLDNGEIVTLKDIIATNPAEFLGLEHVKEYKDNLAILVKVLDSYSRLIIQVHPDKTYARKVLNSDYGKTEAWYVLGTREINGEPPYVLAGFKPGITKQKWKELYEKQDVNGMVDAVHKIIVKPGDVFIIEGGLPHAMGPGVFFIEIQEPTDFTMRTERLSPDGIELPDEQLHQGVGFDKMFECFHYDGVAQEEIMEKCTVKPVVIRQEDGGKEISIISSNRIPYFSMNKIEVSEMFTTFKEQVFNIAIVLSGEGILCWDGGQMNIKQSDEVFLPAGLNEVTWKCTGQKLEVVLCCPPKCK